MSVSDLLERVQYLIAEGEVRISEHGYDELADDGLTAREVVSGVFEAKAVEVYPNYPKGPSVLLLQKTSDGSPIHVVWGIPKGYDKPAVLITAYRPDPARWDENFMRRK
jgi:hypothetical protein